MIGQITYWVSDQRHLATLNDDLKWVAENASIADYLTNTFPAYPDADLPNVVVGRHLLYQTAERLGGSVRVPQRHSAKTSKPALV